MTSCIPGDQLRLTQEYKKILVRIFLRETTDRVSVFKLNNMAESEVGDAHEMAPLDDDFDDYQFKHNMEKLSSEEFKENTAKSETG